MALYSNTHLFELAMHPQAFLRTFWRMELRPQVFVAMSFAPQYTGRFDRVIAPAIEQLSVAGAALKAHRVDLSKSGDSILTDIVDGIAHSQLVLADVSSIGRDAVTGQPYRNGNVMYEVGIALACRLPSEVLLLRDDEDKFLFDVSSIPHMKVNFSDEGAAITQVRDALRERLRERQLVQDARVELAIAGLTNDEVVVLHGVVDYPDTAVWGREETGGVDFQWMTAVPRLLDKEIIRVAGEFEKGHPAYALTPLGKVAVGRLKAGLRKFKPDPQSSNDPTQGSAAAAV